MQFSAALQAPHVETIDGQDVSFPLLKSTELAPLAERIRAFLKKESAENAMLAKLNPAQTYRALQEVSERAILLSDIAGFCRTDQGAIAAVDASLAKTDATPEQRKAVIESIDPVSLAGVALIVTRFSKITKGAKKPESDAVDRPLTGTAVQTPTGASSAESSDGGSTPTPAK